MTSRLQEMRKRAGWKNADDFARHIGMAPKTYRNYEQGVRRLALDVASDICNALDCSLDDLIDKNEFSRSPELSEDEMEMLECYRALPDRAKRAVLVGLRDFVSSNG